MTVEGDSFPKMTSTDLYTFFSLLLLTLFSPFFSWPNLLQKRKTFPTIRSVTRNAIYSSLFKYDFFPLHSRETQMSLITEPWKAGGVVRDRAK